MSIANFSPLVRRYLNRQQWTVEIIEKYGGCMRLEASKLIWRRTLASARRLSIA